MVILEVRTDDALRAFGMCALRLAQALEAQLPIYWVPVLKTLYSVILSVTQGPSIWVPGLLGNVSEWSTGRFGVQEFGELILSAKIEVFARQVCAAACKLGPHVDVKPGTAVQNVRF